MRGVFPAHAGMSPLVEELVSVAEGFPRPRGDEPLCAQFFDGDIAFSPPTRG